MPKQSRPEWMTWAKCYQESSLDYTISKFKLMEIKPSRAYWSTTLNRYKAKSFKSKGRFPIYGEEGNNFLCEKVQRHLDLGLPIDDKILRLLLMEYLVESEPFDILRDIGGNMKVYMCSW